MAAIEPDDTCPALEAWRLLDSEAGQPLLEAAADAVSPTSALVRQLRRDWPADAVAAVLELTRARARSEVKFPGHPGLWSDVAGLEQASSRTTAAWKAARFARAGARTIGDLCCGIGGDAMSLAEVGEVIGVDLDPVRAWMTARNAGCETRVADVLEHHPLPEFLHIDPARREDGSGRRRWRPDQYQPPLPDVLELMRGARGAACKLGPGIPLPLPGAPADSELEFIQQGARLVQSVLWTGELTDAPGARSATLLPDGETLVGPPGEPEVAEREPEPGAYLIEPRAALERAGLVPTALGERVDDVHEIAPGLGLLQSGRPMDSPWFADWSIGAVLPLREKPIRAWLRGQEAGEVVVRTRDRVVEVDDWARRLRGRGERVWTLFALRLGVRTRAILAQPVG